MGKELNKQHGIVYRTKDLHSKGYNNYVIKKMLSNGEIQKVCHGVYALDDIKLFRLTDINVMVENGIISLLSAAMYYELYDGSVSKCVLTISRDQKPPQIPYDIFSYIYISQDLYDIGLKVIDQNGREIKIYELERTICDLLKHRNKYDKQIINQIFLNYLKRDDKDLDKLIAYSKQLRVYNVVKQYLEILGVFNE